MKKAVMASLLLFALDILGAGVYYKLDSLETVKKAPKKIEGLAITGKGYTYETKTLKVEVEPLLLKDMDAYFKERGMENPFTETPDGFNYIFFRVRMENLSKETALEFSPASVIMNDMVTKDDQTVYEMFYDKPNGEVKLETLGKTMFFKPLTLPPGKWIERLLFFEYDDLAPSYKMMLVFANLTAGKKIFELQFPFYSKFVKEKVNE